MGASSGGTSSGSGGSSGNGSSGGSADSGNDTDMGSKDFSYTESQNGYDVGNEYIVDTSGNIIGHGTSLPPGSPIKITKNTTLLQEDTNAPLPYNGAGIMLQ
jgi:hypothetical protein